MPLSEALSRNWIILGNICKMGAKAEELMRKEKAISDAGFSTHPRIVLAMDFVEAFLKCSGVNETMSDEQAKAAIMKADFTKDEIKQIMDAVKWFGPVSLLVRSSAYGDASGTGIYESVVLGKENQETVCETARLLEEIKKVLASHYTEGAKIFREKLALPSGIAVIIEPAFVQSMTEKFNDSSIYPAFNYESCEFGGIGRTSETNMHGKKEEAVYISAGLPNKVVGHGGGIRISPNDFTDGGASIRDFAKNYLKHFNRDELLLIMKKKIRKAFDEGYVIGKEGIYCTNNIDCGSFSESLDDLIFNKLRKLENALGIPQYIEFGVRRIGGKSKTGCFQIADEKKASKERVELYQEGERLIWSDLVMGKGVFDSDMIAMLTSPMGAGDLYQFNLKNKGYILAYFGNFISRTKDCCIGIKHVSNASVLAEYIPNIDHEDLAKHWGGLSNVLGKLLMGTSGDFSWVNSLNCIENGKNGFRVFKGNFRAVSDGRQAIIYDMGKSKDGV